MAIMYIIPIRSHLDRTLSYVGNEVKTKNQNYEEAFLDLHNALSYSLDDLKTEKQFFVSISESLTSVQTVFQEMMNTKEAYQKKNGMLL